MPTDFTRRSFVHRTLVAHGAVFEEIDGGAVAIAYRDAPGGARADRLGLADLCVLARTGFKGRNALAALAKQGVSIEAAPNRAFRQSGGGLAVVLAPTELLLLGPISGDGSWIASFESAWSLDEADGCYLAPRRDSHYWFALTGAPTSAMLAKLCGVDLRPGSFPDLAVAQTSVARSSAIVVRADLGGVPVFHLLGDSASAEYMWDCLIDAMAEFGGRPLGLAALRDLDRAPTAQAARRRRR